MSKVDDQVKKIFQDLLDSFRPGGKSTVAIDIGQNAVKLVELVKSGSKDYKLASYHSIVMPEGVIIDSEILKPDELTATIIKLVQESKVPAVNVCIGLNGHKAVVKKIQLPGGESEELDDQVMWEIEQYLPFAIDDASVSYHVLGENVGGGVDVIVAVAPNDLIDVYRGICEDAKLKLRIVDMNAVAISNVFELAMGDQLNNQTISWLVLDIGAQTTQFIIYKNSGIIFSKDINIGGLQVTEEIQRRMGVNYYEAEDLKIHGDAQGAYPEEIVEIINSTLQTFYSELKKIMDFYISTTSDESLYEVYVTGGSSLLPGMKEGLETLFEVKVHQLDPLECIKYDKKVFKNSDENYARYASAVAIGLGIRAAER